MIPDERHKPYIYEDDDMIEMENVASVTECTGLIPSAPVTDAEAEAYAELYSIPKAKVRPGRDLQNGFGQNPK